MVVAVPGRYCVSYLIVGPRSMACVDVGSGEDLPLIEAVAEWLGKQVSLVVPSHLHFDHVLGVDRACERLGARLGLSRVALRRWERGGALRLPPPRSWLVFPRTWVWQGLPLFARCDLPLVRRFARPLRASPFHAPPEFDLVEGGAIEGCPGWSVLSTPGHADEAVCLYHRRAGFLVGGDTVRNFEGGEWNPLLTDRADYRATVERLQKLFVQAVFPGHGPVIVGEGVLGRLRSL